MRRLTVEPGAAQRVAELPPTVLAEASRLVPELGDLRAGLPPAAPGDSPGAASRFVSALADVLSAFTAGPAPGLFVLDDAQWADSASLDVIGFLGTAPAWPRYLHRAVVAPGGSSVRPPAARARGRRAPLAVGAGRGSKTARPRGGRRARPRCRRREYGRPAVRPDRRPAVLRRRVPRCARRDERGASGRCRTASPSCCGSRLAALGELRAPGPRGRGRARQRRSIPTLCATTSGRSDEEVVAALEELERARRARRGRTARSTSATSRSATSSTTDMTLARRRLLHRRAAAALGARDRARAARGRGDRAPPRARRRRAAEAAELYRARGRPGARALRERRGARPLPAPRSRSAIPDAAVLHEAIGDLADARGRLRRRARELSRPRRRSHAPELQPRGRAPASAPAPPPRRVGAGRGVARGRARRPRGRGAPHARPPTAASPRTAAAWRPRQRELAAEALALAEQAGDPRALAQAHNILGILAASRGDGAEPRQDLDAGARARQETRRPGGRGGRAEQPRARGRRRRRSPSARSSSRGPALARAVGSATATARPRCATASPTCSTPPAATTRRWRS